MRRFEYLHDCVSCPRQDVEELTACVDRAIEITRRTFLRHVSRGDLDAQAEAMGYALHPRHGMTMAADWHITYHRSVFKGQRCYYFCWSGIEHLFIEKGARQ